MSTGVRSDAEFDRETKTLTFRLYAIATGGVTRPGATGDRFENSDDDDADKTVFANIQPTYNRTDTILRWTATVFPGDRCAFGRLIV